MKILWLSHLVPYPPKAGVLLRAHHLLKELARYHDVDLLALSQRSLLEPYFDSYDDGIRESTRVLSEFCNNIEILENQADKSANGKKLIAARSLVSPMPYTINWLQDDRYGRLVNDLTDNNAYDFIHCDTLSLAPYVLHLNNVCRGLDHHNVESHLMLRRAAVEKNLLKKVFFWLEGKRLQKLEQRWCPVFDTNITCSELDSERFRSFCPNASFTEIKNGVDVDFFTPSNGPVDPATFIFIGTLDWYPNTRAVRYIANEIWPLLKSALPDAKINIIGANPPADLLELHDQDAQFNVLGFVDDIAPYLEQATAYICPIDDGGGTKLKLLDAMASGKAIVAHEVACEGLAITNGEQLLIANSPAEYISAIQGLVTNAETRQELEIKARQHAVDHFSFVAIGKKLSDHYNSVAANRKAACAA
jgi:glycosyltransferase involved in cell wall biosynthesis